MWKPFSSIPGRSFFASCGGSGFVEMLLYIGILLVGYFYLWKKGARLEPPRRTPGSRFVTETSDLEQNPAISRIRAWRPAAIAELISFRGELTVVVPREHLRPLAEFLAGDPDLAFTYLSDVTGVDRFPVEPRFELNYHLLSMSRRDSLRLRVRLPGDSPVIGTVVPVWPTANWHERDIRFVVCVLKGVRTCAGCCCPTIGKATRCGKDYPVEVLTLIQVNSVL